MVNYFLSIARYIPPPVRAFLKRLVRRKGIEHNRTNQQLSNVPPNFADRYVDWQIRTVGGGRGIEVPWVLRHVREIIGCRVLDVGCINFDPPWSRVCTECYLLDTHNFLVTVDQRMPCYVVEDYHFCQADASRLPFRNDVFDLILCISTLEHVGLLAYGRQEVDNKAEGSSFLEMIRVLRPGGQLLLTVPFGAEMIYDGWIRSYTRPRLDSLVDQTSKAGYAVIEVEASYFKNTRQGWIYSTAAELYTIRQYDGMSDICGLYCGVFTKR